MSSHPAHDAVHPGTLLASLGGGDDTAILSDQLLSVDGGSGVDRCAAEIRLSCEKP